MSLQCDLHAASISWPRERRELAQECCGLDPAPRKTQGARPQERKGILPIPTSTCPGHLALLDAPADVPAQKLIPSCFLWL